MKRILFAIGVLIMSVAQSATVYNYFANPWSIAETFSAPVTLTPTSSTALTINALSGQNGETINMTGNANSIMVSANSTIPAKIALAGNGNASSLAFLLTQDGSGNAALNQLNNAQLALLTNGATRITIAAAGSVTIATPTSGVGLTVSGGGGSITGTMALPTIASSSAATTGTVCWTTVTGNLTVDTTTTCLASTIKVKQNIEPLNVGLAEVMKLHPVSYELRPEFNPAHLGRQTGLIAEEVIKIDPRLVALDNEGDPRSVRYQQLTAVLVKAIQDQQHEIDELKRRLR